MKVWKIFTVISIIMIISFHFTNAGIPYQDRIEDDLGDVRDIDGKIIDGRSELDIESFNYQFEEISRNISFMLTFNDVPVQNNSYLFEVTGIDERENDYYAFTTLLISYTDVDLIGAIEIEGEEEYLQPTLNFEDRTVIASMNLPSEFSIDLVFANDQFRYYGEVIYIPVNEEQLYWDKVSNEDLFNPRVSNVNLERYSVFFSLPLIALVMKWRQKSSEFTS